MTRAREAHPTRRGGTPPHQKPASRIGTWTIITVVAAAVLIVVGLAMFGQTRPQASQTTVPTAGNVKGDPAAPVEIEEWADFQ